MADRHFPPPWIVEELDACFVVTDSAGAKAASRRKRIDHRGVAELTLDKLRKPQLLSFLKPCDGQLDDPTTGIGGSHGVRFSSTADMVDEHWHGSNMYNGDGLKVSPAG
jgi:hypothetical protein